MQDSTLSPSVSTPLDELLGVHRRARTLLEGLEPEILGLGAAGAGTVGAQLRHFLEFPTRLLAGLPDGRIDYDRRERDENLERDPALLRAAFVDVECRLRALADDGDLDADVEVRHDTAPDLEGVWSRSTLGRELRFVCSHSIHHLALVALVLRSHGHEPDAELGVAPSTLAHRRSAASCAP